MVSFSLQHVALTVVFYPPTCQNWGQRVLGNLRERAGWFTERGTAKAICAPVSCEGGRPERLGTWVFQTRTFQWLETVMKEICVTDTCIKGLILLMGKILYLKPCGIEGLQTIICMDCWKKCRRKLTEWELQPGRHSKCGWNWQQSFGVGKCEACIVFTAMVLLWLHATWGNLAWLWGLEMCSRNCRRPWKESVPWTESVFFGAISKWKSNTKRSNPKK